MCSQLDKFLEVAAGEVGYIEGPADNQTKYQKTNQPWCGAFVNWVAKQAGVKIPNCVYTPAGAKAFAEAKRWQDLATAEPMPGDLAFFDFPNDGIDRILTLASSKESRRMALSSPSRATLAQTKKATSEMVAKLPAKFALTKLKIGGNFNHLCLWPLLALADQSSRSANARQSKTHRNHKHLRKSRSSRSRSSILGRPIPPSKRLFRCIHGSSPWPNTKGH
jgi:hypothetical protein